MVKVETRAKKGFEDIHELLTKKLEDLEAEIAKEFESRKLEIVNLLKEVSEEYTVELPDETPCDIAIDPTVNPDNISIEGTSADYTATC